MTITTDCGKVFCNGVRHTAATLMLAAGEHVKFVRERLGYTNVQTTLTVYPHVLPTMQKSAAERMPKLLG